MIFIIYFVDHYTVMGEERLEAFIADHCEEIIDIQAVPGETK